MRNRTNTIVILLLFSFFHELNAYETSFPQIDAKVVQPLSDTTCDAAEDARQLDALEAQLRAEMRGNYASYTPALANNLNSYNRPIIRPTEVPRAYGGPVQTDRKLNFDILQNRQNYPLNDRFIDADLEKIDRNPSAAYQPNVSGTDIISSTLSEGSAKGEDVFVDALKQVLMTFKQEMMKGKFGDELREKAFHLNQQYSRTPGDAKSGSADKDNRDFYRHRNPFDKNSKFLDQKLRKYHLLNSHSKIENSIGRNVDNRSKIDGEVTVMIGDDARTVTPSLTGLMSRSTIAAHKNFGVVGDNFRRAPIARVDGSVPRVRERILYSILPSRRAMDLY